MTAKDIVLAILGVIGTGGGMGHVIEYRGSAIRALSMEGRMTVSNMTIEGGARPGSSPPTTRPSPTSKAVREPRRARTGSARSTTGARS